LKKSNSAKKQGKELKVSDDEETENESINRKDLILSPSKKSEFTFVPKFFRPSASVIQAPE
jgi:hypothetical protein